MDCSLLRLLCPWTSPGKNTGVGSHFLLQGIFLKQGSNSGVLHCRQILYCLNHQGSSFYLLKIKTKLGSLPFLLFHQMPPGLPTLTPAPTPALQRVVRSNRWVKPEISAWISGSVLGVELQHGAVEGCLIIVMKPSPTPLGLPWWLSGKESTCNAEDTGSTSGSGRCPGGGRSNPR